MSKARVLVIGLDGASPQLIQEWIEDLPNLRRLSTAGVHGIAESIVPPSSVPAWQCFATGKNPARIGLFGFATIDRQHHLVKRSLDSSSGLVWDACSKNGLRVGVFNVPGTYPPSPLNGFMVCGFPVPPGKDWAYPRDLMQRLDKEVSGYEVDVPLTKPSDMKGGENAYLSQVERLHRKSLASALALMDWFDPDFYFLTLQGVDMVQHDFWRYMNQENSAYRTVIRDWYKKLDGAVGELVEKAGPEANVLVVSDHGSVPVSLSFHVNEFLRKQGLLVLKDEARVRHKGSSYSRLRNVIMRNFPSNWVNAIYKNSPNFLARKLTVSAKLERFLTDLLDNIDWDRTRVFATGGVQANLYLSGSNGNISGSNQDHLRGLFDNLDHPVTGERLRAVFHLRDSVFAGPYTSEAPDACVELFHRDQKVHVNPVLGSDKTWSFEPHLSAEHVREGFWLLAGPGIRGGVQMDCSILDLCPTLLKLMGMDPPADVDGKVLSSAFIDSLEVHPLAIKS